MKSLYIEHKICVSTYDIDFAGHVSNIVYLRWLEDMRLKMFELYCPLKQFLDIGVTPVLASTEINYKKPIRLFDKPYGKMWLSDLGKTSLSIEAEIYLAETLAASAKHVGVFVEVSRMKPVRIPRGFLDAVQKCDEDQRHTGAMIGWSRTESS